MLLARAGLIRALGPRRTLAMAHIFISYTDVDHLMAKWIAWQLELAGHSTILQAWDFLPGQNFVLEMQRAVLESDLTIVVLSEDYQRACFTQPEWAAAFALDPMGAGSRLIPVRVQDCEPRGLLKQIIYIDLAGYLEDAARQRLLAGISAVAPAGSNQTVRARLKPEIAPEYPNLIHQVEATRAQVQQDSYLRDEIEKENTLKRLQNELKVLVPGVSDLSIYQVDFPWPSIDLEMKLLLRKQAGDTFLRIHLDSFVNSIYEHEKAAHHAAKLCLILLDVDELTIITKKFGAEAGSLVLIETINIIRSNVKSPKIGRCGDDTFYILLPNHSTNQALALARRLCKLVRKHRWFSIAAGLRVTISAGVVRLKRSEPSIDMVIRAANGFKVAKAYGGDRAELGPVLLEHEVSRNLRDHYS
jgi:diguanylate cyclase (GGDEF)-like protein